MHPQVQAGRVRFVFDNEVGGDCESANARHMAAVRSEMENTTELPEASDEKAALFVEQAFHMHMDHVWDMFRLIPYLGAWKRHL